MTEDEILALMEEAHRAELRERQKFHMRHGAGVAAARAARAAEVARSRQPEVPSDRAIRRASTPNQPTERLHRRSAWIWDRISLRDHDWSRMQFAYRALELKAIELELVRRGELSSSDRKTTGGE